MAALEVKLEGAEELERLLRQLPVRMRKKHLRRAIRRGIVLVRDQIKTTAPVGVGPGKVRHGRLRRLVRIKARRGKRGYLKVSLIYPTEGAEGDPKNAFFWRFVEFGTKFKPIQRLRCQGFASAREPAHRAAVSADRPV